MKGLFIVIALSGAFWAFGQNLEVLIQREVEYQHFSGCIQVKKGEMMIYERCVGVSDMSTQKQNNVDTPFDIGSVSKQFTASAILHLVHSGQLDLQTPINMYLDNFASSEWEEVTVHHLLTHTSGIPSLFQSGQGIEAIMPTVEAVSLDMLISYFSDAETLFDPGEEYQYSNSGYILLAAIIEKVSGEDYAHFIEKMLGKYGLEQTVFGPPQNTEFAWPHYGYRQDLMKPGNINHASWAIGAGGIYSTVSDLILWAEIIQSEIFLSPELRKLYFQPHTKRGGGRYYGYGWDISPDEKIISHDGMNFGYVSYLGFRPEDQTSVAILTNQSYESITLTGASAFYINELQSKIWNILDEQQVEVLPKLVDNTLLEGIYELNDGTRFSIKKQDTSYLITTNSDYPLTRLSFAHPLAGKDKMSTALQKIGIAIEKDNFWSMAGVCDGQMKFAIYTGLFSWGFGQVTADLGDIHKVIPYRLADQGYLRIYGSKEILDIIVYFNEDQDVQGVFEHGFYDRFSKKELIAFSTGNELYLDGFPYGEYSLNIRPAPDGLELLQFGRSFYAKRVSSTPDQ